MEKNTPARPDNCPLKGAFHLCPATNELKPWTGISIGTGSITAGGHYAALKSEGWR